VRSGVNDHFGALAVAVSAGEKCPNLVIASADA